MREQSTEDSAMWVGPDHGGSAGTGSPTLASLRVLRMHDFPGDYLPNVKDQQEPTWCRLGQCGAYTGSRRRGRSGSARGFAAP
jgi:hypothetical protein